MGQHARIVCGTGDLRMVYLITFLEGLISFISPCMLPMLPLYVSYFGALDNTDKAQTKASKGRVLLRAASFVVGFTLVFCLLGVFAGTLGAFLMRYRTVVNLVTGAIVILFGLSYLEVFRLPFFRGIQKTHKIDSPFSAFLFGVVYSVSLTPCVGAFLGSALMLASSGGGALRGALLLLAYSLGLGVPFLFSAVLLDALSDAFRAIKRHYTLINRICGIFLIAVGVLMAGGWMNSILSLFA